MRRGPFPNALQNFISRHDVTGFQSDLGSLRDSAPLHSCGFFPCLCWRASRLGIGADRWAAIHRDLVGDLRRPGWISARPVTSRTLIPSNRTADPTGTPSRNSASSSKGLTRGTIRALKGGSPDARLCRHDGEPPSSPPPPGGACVAAPYYSSMGNLAQCRCRTVPYD
jgi:hypothetical protein